MGLPVFFSAAEVSAALPRGAQMTVRDLCKRAGIACRVTGAPASRPVRLGKAPVLRAVRLPGPMAGVWIGVPSGPSRTRAWKALGLLAYGVFDYCARESLRGIAVAKPSPGPGRPRTGFAMSVAERQRRHRNQWAR